MKTEAEIKAHLEFNRLKLFPKGEYWEGTKESYIAALRWTLE